MTITIELAPEAEARLRKKAEERGQEPAGYVTALLTRDLNQDLGPGEAEPKNLAEMLAGRVGLFHSGGESRLSENCGEKFTDYLVEKRKAGRL